MWLNELSGMSLALSTVTRSFPLLKNGQDQVCPIVMPTMFRKLQATLTSLQFSEAVRDFTGPTQFGNQRNGCARFGRWVNLHKQRFPSHACVQLDLQDALCERGRSCLYQTTRGIAPGDPMSTMGFCIVIESVRRTWMATAPERAQWGANAHYGT